MHNKFIYKYLNDDELQKISNAIRDVEKNTAGEIVISIKRQRRVLEKSKPLRALAEKEFIRAGITKTKSATGILIFLVFLSKEFYILVDKSINEKVEQSVWDGISKNMSKHFRQGNFCNGIIEGITECGKILSAHFPIQPGDVNELPNKVRTE